MTCMRRCTAALLTIALSARASVSDAVTGPALDEGPGPTTPTIPDYYFYGGIEEPGTTSAEYKKDLVEFFKDERYRNETILEIGCRWGSTARVLAQLFQKVLCVELEVPNLKKIRKSRDPISGQIVPRYDFGRNGGGGGFTREDGGDGARADGRSLNAAAAQDPRRRHKQRRRQTQREDFYPNIIFFNVNLYHDDWSAFSHNAIDVVHIDARHEYEFVSQDIRNSIAIECCVHTLVFHDWHMAPVQQAILENNLPILRKIGQENWGDSGQREGVVTSAVGVYEEEGDLKMRDIHATWMLAKDILVQKSFVIYDIAPRELGQMRRDLLVFEPDRGTASPTVPTASASSEPRGTQHASTANRCGSELATVHGWACRWRVQGPHRALVEFFASEADGDAAVLAHRAMEEAESAGTKSAAAGGGNAGGTRRAPVFEPSPSAVEVWELLFNVGHTGFVLFRDVRRGEDTRAKNSKFIGICYRFHFEMFDRFNRGFEEFVRKNVEAIQG